ncbi:MAG: pilus assembly protein PilP [Thermodesulfobacteriota bacterium]|jgi:Tfp pilus assembly protein PilP
MKKGLVLFLFVLLAIAGCSQKAQEGSSTKKILPVARKDNSVPSPTILQPSTLSLVEGSELTPPFYDPKGKPDPFQPTKVSLEAKDKGKGKVLPLEQFEVNEYELVSIVSGSGIKKAMVQDLTGKGFLIQVGTRIGKRNGKVIRITDRQVVVEEPFQDFLGRKSSRKILLSIPQSE